MRIGLQGSVYACNHNISFSLGKFPEKSLVDIWKGKPIKKLRRLLRHNDFSLGCTMCEEDAINERFGAASFTLFDRYKADQWPVMLDFRLSNSCNLQCIMCSGLSSSQFFQQSEPIKNVFDETFLNQLDAFIPHLDTARFIGGEPFAIPVYFEIWERIVKSNPECKIIVQTNATILNDRVRQLAERGNFHFSVSLDSLNKETYEAIRRNANFNQVMDHIRFFANYSKTGQRDFVLCFCPMRMNYHEIPAFIDFSNKMDALICLNRFFYPARLAVWSLKTEEISEIFDTLSSYQPDENTTTSANNAGFFRDYMNLLQQWIIQAEQRESQNISQDDVAALTGPLLELATNEEELFIKVQKIADFPDLQKLYWYLKPVRDYYNPQLFFDFLNTSDINKVMEDIKAVQA